MGALSFGHDVWWIIPALWLAGWLTWWTYRKSVPRLSPWLGWFVPLLRFSSLSLILFLLLEPLLSRTRTIVTPPLLAVLVDESESLGVTGAVDTSSGPALEQVREALRRIPLSEVNGEVRLFGFGSGVRPLDPETSWPDSLRFDEQRTNFSLGLERIRDDLAGANLRVVLLVSDGRHNTGRNPVFIADRFAVPIITGVTGDTTTRRDLYLRSIVTNEIGYVDSELPVRALVRAEGIEARDVEVRLAVEGELVDSRTIRIQPGVEQAVDMTFEPDSSGLKRVSVSVTRVDGEVTYRNNVESAAVQVLNSRKRVLLLGSGPGPDLSSLRQILERDRNVDLTVSVYRDGTEYYESVLPSVVASFDLVVLAGFPGNSTPATVVSTVASALADSEDGTGPGLLFVLGHETDLGQFNRYFAPLLPVHAGAIRAQFTESTAAITETGRAHPVVSPLELEPRDWDRLPPIYTSASRWEVAPDGRVLATARVRGVTLPDPLVAVMQRPDARAAAVLAAGTWRWKNLPEDLATYEELWPDVVGNLVVWLTAENDDRPVRVRPATASFAGSDRIRFSGQVYDESLQPISDAAVEVSVLAPAGARYPFTMDPAGNGLYALETDALPGGSYRYRATAERDGTEIGSDEGSFVVGDLALEFKETRADPVLMRQLSQRSGGLAVRTTELTDLARQLASLDAWQPRIETATRESELWRRSVFLGIIVFLLTLEWFLRKRSGLV